DARDVDDADVGLEAHHLRRAAVRKRALQQRDLLAIEIRRALRAERLREHLEIPELHGLLDHRREDLSLARFPREAIARGAGDIRRMRIFDGANAVEMLVAAMEAKSAAIFVD